MKNIEKLDWLMSFSIGNKKIDLEHQQLLNIYNDLVLLINKNGNREEFASILSKMTDYSMSHYKNEEEYMLKFNYPGYKKHREEHKEFVYKVAIYNTELLTINPPNPIDIIEYIKNWFNNHILKEDLKYEQYKKDKGLNIEY